MQGWGAGRGGGGVGGKPGPTPPPRSWQRRLGGAVPGWAGPWRTFFLPWTLRRAPGTAPWAQSGGGRTTPRLWAHYSQLQGAPLPTRAPPSLGQHLASRKGRSPGRERGWGWRGGVWGAGVGSGRARAGLHPIILRSWSSGLPGGAPAEQRVCAGEGPPRKGGGGGRAPAELCAGCFAGAGGLGSVPGGPEGRRAGAGAGRQCRRILAGRVPFACFSLLGCWCTAPPRSPPRALRGLGLLLGPAGVPGLEERRAEWLTTL